MQFWLDFYFFLHWVARGGETDNSTVMAEGFEDLSVQQSEDQVKESILLW